MKRASCYNTYLAAGLGALPETRTLLGAWQPGVAAADLYKAVLDARTFPRLSARRLKNLVLDCFARRFLVKDGTPAVWLKTLAPALSPREFDQVAFVHACRASPVLADFVTEVYWPCYVEGHDLLSNQEARTFVVRANQEGRTGKEWAEGTIRRVAGYLTGACADFGLLEGGARTTRRILLYRIEPGAAATLAYDLHLAGLGDNAVVGSPDWKLFGMDERDVVAELKQLALKKLLIVQAAGAAVRIAWKFANVQELADALAQG